MTHEKVLEMLRQYRFAVGRCSFLETEIGVVKKELLSAERVVVEDAASIQAQQITGMPRGTSVGNPVERIGLMLASGWLPETVTALRERLSMSEKEYHERRVVVVIVAGWLSGLTDRERWIIEHQVIDEEFWRDIIRAYKDRFQEEMSKDTLKRLKAKALKKIFRMAE